jgi:hypothetical protein
MIAFNLRHCSRLQYLMLLWREQWLRWPEAPPCKQHSINRHALLHLTLRFRFPPLCSCSSSVSAAAVWTSALLVGPTAALPCMQQQRQAVQQHAGPSLTWVLTHTALTTTGSLLLCWQQQEATLTLSRYTSSWPCVSLLLYTIAGQLLALHVPLSPAAQTN